MLLAETVVDSYMFSVRCSREFGLLIWLVGDSTAAKAVSEAKTVNNIEIY